MSVTTTTHLNFRGQARAALDHYAAVVGGEVLAFTFAQAGDETDAADGAVPEELKWGQVTAPSGFAVMAYDVPPGRGFDRGQDPVFVSVRGDDPEEVTRLFAGLADGGTVRTPLAPAGYAPLYGMVTDRFGITWVLDVVAPFGA
ncbi:VOC family protein [Cellulomonas marina]|uniref:PhnB protein n=1 Tax=Cellulomonas marina TaxID=988821 RepID=A0A1I0XB92_9CELL|nr:VOC family protein [Cellulomonas marina]GIG29528.1 VOC family protein [Cellulomonas marina]SFA97558.1 PhnB protein [Cellulomonas marina]